MIFQGTIGRGQTEPFLGGRFWINVSIDDSSIYPDEPAAGGGAAKGNPSFRTFRATNALALRNGETGQFTTDGLYLFMEPTSPKGTDLRQREQFAIHNGVPDNAGTGGEASVSGTAHPVDDAAVRGGGPGDDLVAL